MTKHEQCPGDNPSRSELLWPGVIPDAVCHGLVHAHGENAGTEALLRAFLAERHGDRGAARFWIAVYGRLISATLQPP